MQIIIYKDADRIVVLDKGRIVDVAPHDELIKRCSVYQEIYNSQLKGGSSNE